MAWKKMHPELREIVRERLLRDAESALRRAEELVRPSPDGKDWTALDGGWGPVRREVRIARAALDEAIDVLLANPQGKDVAPILAPIRIHLYEMANERNKRIFLEKLAVAAEWLRKEQSRFDDGEGPLPLE
jgi:hypothetical protein